MKKCRFRGSRELPGPRGGRPCSPVLPSTRPRWPHSCWPTNHLPLSRCRSQEALQTPATSSRLGPLSQIRPHRLPPPPPSPLATAQRSSPGGGISGTGSAHPGDLGDVLRRASGCSRSPGPMWVPLGQQTPPWAMGPRPTLCRGKIRTRPVSLPFREKTQMTREKGHNYRLSHVLGRKCKERCPRTDVGAQRPQAVTHGRWKLRATQKPVMAPRSTGAECRSVSLFLLRTPCQWPAHTQASLKQLLSTAATGRCFLAPLTD